MPTPRPWTVRKGQVAVFAGTTKGLFAFTSNSARDAWRVAGPLFPGEQVPALAVDDREGFRLLAGTDSAHWGPKLRWSDDLGSTWSEPAKDALRFPADTGLAVERVWQIQPATEREPGVVYAGVAPAALFVSRDRGESWELVRGLFDHPHRPRWQPGAGGLCLHTILPDVEGRDRLTVAISAAGVYRSEDGGESWRPRNEGVRAEFLPDKHPEFGQCVHKIVRHPARPATLFLQNHWGLYRSDDAGDTWRDIARGVPSDFGFCMTMHPHDPDVVYILPLESDTFRCTPAGRLRVYRTLDGGGRWQSLEDGLPQRDAFETVLRDAMCTDELNPAGIYFGTRSGKLFASADGGVHWQRLADGLPPVLCVRAAFLGNAARVRVPAAAPARAARTAPRPAARASRTAKRAKPPARRRAAR